MGSSLSQVEASSGGSGEGEGMMDALTHIHVSLSKKKSMKICPWWSIKKQTTHY